MQIPVIDLFAGPGGLGEGFAKSRSAQFNIVVSIEKDPMAAETLRLRAAHRALQRNPAVGDDTWRIWDDLVDRSPWNIVFEVLLEKGGPLIREACRIAQIEAWNVELGLANRDQISEGIRKRIRPYMKGGSLPNNTVLIGGPPCQAYSVVGRSRNRGKKDYKPENDHRHFLYREYLAVINEFRPAVFVMENVKGILTSKVDGWHIFESIRSDLVRPDIACGSDTNLRYVLVALPQGATNSFISPEPEDFIIRAEKYGIPQARHRVVICGVRKDVFERAGFFGALTPSAETAVGEVITGLPELRPKLSFRGKGLAWQDSLGLPIMVDAIRELEESRVESFRVLAGEMRRSISRICLEAHRTSGADRLPMRRAHAAQRFREWYRDRPLSLLCNHESRSHMPDDIARYFFVSMFGKVIGQSPRLEDFPQAMLPKHKNVDPDRPQAAIFKDRFRVQIEDRPSMTVTCHIGKDGHAFIHPDPMQCRSLTVREAARLQTFPDSYVFLGSRTSQYTQVGNAVPPKLAQQIAELVGRVLNC